MCELTDKYNLYKEAIEIQNYFNNFEGKGNLIVVCSNCGKKLTVYGCTSHYKICNNIYDDKFKLIKNYFNGYENSVFSNEKITYSHNRRLDRLFLVVKNTNEWRKINSFVYNYENYYKKCKYCGNGFMSKEYDYCSKSCSVTNYHLVYKNKKSYKERNNNISKTRIQNNIIQEPWNKGLRGEEYLKHYINESGENTLYKSIAKNNSFFKKTSIEIKMEDILKKLNIKYKYNYFNEVQIDFKCKINNKTIFIETDGDYWHKSSRRCFDKNERNIKRLEDKLKEIVIIRKFPDAIFIRFWEYNINNDIDYIEKLIIDLMQNLDNPYIINNIKEYYNTNS